jgi:hypothetical protein
MPVLAGSAYNTAEDVLNRLRVFLNDSEIAGGDVVTDTAPFSFQLLNGAFESVAYSLSVVGDETFTKEAWMLALPVMPTIDPEARLVIDDTGTSIIYPSGVGNTFAATPQLPLDLIVPFALWERQAGTSTFTGPPMKQANDGLLNMQQQQSLIDWEWKSDGLYFRGATQSEDVKIKYLKRLAQLAATTDPVPIRGVVNAAAYEAAKIFCASRGGAILPQFKAEAEAEVFKLKQMIVSRKQRKQVRRQPYSGRGGRYSTTI